MQNKIKAIGIIFAVAFIGSCISQWLLLSERDLVDYKLWAKEAEYVQTGNPLAYERGAYGYPAGPVIYGTIITHNVTNLSYEDSQLLSLMIFNSMAIACICIITYLIGKDFWWPAATLLVLAMSPMFQYSTPTTSYSSLTAVILCLITLYIMKMDKRTLGPLLLWAGVAGFLVSIRADIGSIFVLAMGVLIYKFEYKYLLMPVIAALIFIIFDPFLWMKPLTHIPDIVELIIWGYFDYLQARINIQVLLGLSVLAIIGALFSCIIMNRPDSPIPRRFTLTLLILTAFLSYIFLTSRSQEIRYFQVLISIWEVMFTYTIFYLISKLDFSFLSSEKKPLALTVTRSLVLVLLFVNSSFVFYVWLIQG